MKSMLRTIAVAFSMVLFSIAGQSATAQSPDKMFGLGIVGGTNLGIEAVYAVTPAVHIGASVGLGLFSANGVSKNSVIFGPFARFIFAGKKNFKPFLAAGFTLVSGDVHTLGLGGVASGSKSMVGFGGGAFYFPANDIDVFGQLTFVGIALDPSSTFIGTLSPHAGVHWYFN